MAHHGRFYFGTRRTIFVHLGITSKCQFGFLIKDLEMRVAQSNTIGIPCLKCFESSQNSQGQTQWTSHRQCESRHV